MSDNTKIRPDWKYDKNVILQTNILAKHKSCTPEEMAEISLVKQYAIELKKLSTFERDMMKKRAIIFDVQALLGTINVSIRGSLAQIICSAITFSDTFLTQIDGKAQEKEYLFALYSKFIDLSNLDKTEFKIIMTHIRKNKRKMNIFKEYIKGDLQ